MDSVNFWVVISGGAFGGLLHALYQNNHRLLLPGLLRNDQVHIYLGFLADILLGIGASLAILYFIAPDTLFKQIPLSIISGFGGGSFLGTLASKMATESEKKKVDTLEEVVENYAKRYDEILRELEERGGDKS
ncbi:MAG: DUF4257 domain-containing protein [bacterium]